MPAAIARPEHRSFSSAGYHLHSQMSVHPSPNVDLTGETIKDVGPGELDRALQRA